MKTTHTLIPGEYLSRQLSDQDALELVAEAGQLWVTMEGDANDYVLTPGDRQCFHGPGHILIEAIGQEKANLQLAIELQFAAKLLSNTCQV